MTEKPIAVLTLHRAGKWPVELRRKVAKWLGEQQRFLSLEAHNMSDRYSARYLTVDPDKPLKGVRKRAGP
jgi:hypothetical protein